jgi:LAO/AO transport system kinase
MPPVVKAVASSGEGIDELWDAIDAHQGHLAADGDLAVARADRVHREVESIVSELLKQHVEGLLEADPALVADLAARRVDPYAAARILLERTKAGG